MFGLFVALGLLVFGYIIGTSREKSHFKSLRQRESALQEISWRSTGKKEDFSRYQEGRLVSGHVVIGQDYFKAFLGGLINLVGGRLGVYESLLDRGRREAMCRLREEAKSWGCSEIVNVRFETSIIGENTGKKNSGAIEIFTYGTALK
jgi:uncharacterized protein YbjQ (UPF0145 family)